MLEGGSGDYAAGGGVPSSALLMQDGNQGRIIPVVTDTPYGVVDRALYQHITKSVLRGPGPQRPSWSVV